MSNGRWEHLTQHSPVLRFSSWLINQLGTLPYPALSYHSLALEFDLLETSFLSH